MKTDPKKVKAVIRILTIGIKKGGPDGPGVVGRAGLRQWQYDLIQKVRRVLEEK